MDAFTPRASRTARSAPRTGSPARRPSGARPGVRMRLDRRALAASALGLREQLQRAGQAHRVDVVRLRQRAEVALVHHVRAEAPRVRLDLLPRLRVRPQGAREGEQLQREAPASGPRGSSPWEARRAWAWPWSPPPPRPAARRGQSAPAASGSACRSRDRSPARPDPRPWRAPACDTCSAVRSAGAIPSGSDAVKRLAVRLRLRERAEAADAHPRPQALQHHRGRLARVDGLLPRA